MKNNLLTALSPAAWSGFALLFGAAFFYTATVTWLDGGGTAFDRVVVMMYGVLFGEAARRGGRAARGRRGAGFTGRKPRFRGDYLAVAAMIGTLTAIFYPVFTHCGNNAKAVSSLFHLKQGGLAMLQYAQDWDDTLPPQMQTTAVPEYLKPYLPHSESGEVPVLIDPTNRLPYTWRRCLSGLSTTDLTNGWLVVTAYSPLPTVDGSEKRRPTLYLDGHAKAERDDVFMPLLNTEPSHASKDTVSQP